MNHAASSMPSFLPMFTSLLIVLGLFAAAVWGLRRMGIAPRAGAGPMRVVSQLALGPRERVVIVEVGERWVLLGVGASGVTRLGTVAKGDVPASPQPGPAFGALLERLRGGAQ